MPPELTAETNAEPSADTSAAKVDPSTEGEAPGAVVPDQAPEGTESETPAVKEPEFKVPAKFLNEDGTPNIEKLAKSYQTLEKKLGSKPNIPAGSIDDYTIDMPKDSSLVVDEEAAAAFKAEALKLGFTAEQYRFVTDQYFSRMESTTWTPAKAKDALTEDWGGNFDHNVMAARRAFDEFAPSDANINDPVFNHPAILKLMARMGAELNEDGAPPKAGASAKASIQDEIDALRKDPDYYTPAKQKRMDELYSRLYQE